jgi:hypothetical protein
MPSGPIPAATSTAAGSVAKPLLVGCGSCSQVLTGAYCMSLTLCGLWCEAPNEDLFAFRAAVLAMRQAWLGINLRRETAGATQGSTALLV